MQFPVVEGVNVGHAAAGFGGALASLPFLPPGNKWSIFLWILIGLVTAAFLTPMVAEVLASQKALGVPMSHRAELGLGFILGLTAMFLLPIFINVVKWFGANVDALLQKFTGIQKPPEPPKPPGA